jgi:outer membrane protein OmpA-like peptidoglycan-associated protein
MTFRKTLLAASVLAVPISLVLRPAAQAQPVTGLYVGGSVGANWLQDETVRLAPPSTDGSTTKLKGNFETGIVGLVSVGWGFGNGLRVELEGNFRDNGVNRFSGTPFPTKAGGEQQSYGAMVNALYDFDIGFPWIYPYVGVGAGWAHNKLRAGTDGTNYPFSFRVDDENDNFAYQAILGAAFPVPYVPGLSLTAEYRFFGEANPGSYYGAITAPNPAAGGALTQTSTKLKVGQDLNHSFLVGVRYAFNVAPPPPPPAPVVAPPAPAPTRTYLVFFDWDRADLSDRARQIISDAARNSTRVQYTRIEVNGYTDTSGTPQYNLRLSVRRAESVRAELIRDGVPANAIDIHGYGETHLLVPTGPGVREPQNRRVEIIIQ